MTSINNASGAIYKYYYYYWFIVRVPVVLDFLFITFRLHLFLSWMASLSISRSAISVCLSWFSNRSSSFSFDLHSCFRPVFITCPYHPRLPLLMTVVICSTPTSLLNSSLVVFFVHGNITHPSNHLYVCLLIQTVAQHQLARA